MADDLDAPPNDIIPVPPEDAMAFREMRVLALKAMTFLINDAEKYQTLIKEAKTSSKREFYTRKFQKVKIQFQDEIARLAQLEHTMKENNISFDEPDGDIVNG